MATIEHVEERGTESGARRGDVDHASWTAAGTPAGVGLARTT